MMKRIYRAMTVAVLSFMLCWGGGCGTGKPSSGRNEVSKSPISKDEAVSIATAHLRKNDRLPSEFQVGSVEQGETGEWTVLIEGLPPTPGRHILVTVGKDGSVLEVSRGR
jgi:hypothetical protein